MVMVIISFIGGKKANELFCSSSKKFSFDLGPIHFVGVSTEYYGFFNEYGHIPVINQYNWLENDLKVNFFS